MPFSLHVMYNVYTCILLHLTCYLDCSIDVNNNDPAGLEHCKLIASLVQYLITEGKHFKFTRDSFVSIQCKKNCQQ